jgi:WD40 repeat protein
MAPALPILLAVLAVISLTASAQEVAYAYGESGGRPLGSGDISQYNGSDIVTSSIAGGGQFVGGSGMTVDEMKGEISLKLNVGNPKIRDEGLRMILEYPGDGTINQICSIYEHMVGNWSYARDPHGGELLQYSNQSLDYGKGKFSGQGDCDDFAILLASLIESIGGTSRIILAYGASGGHAYTEVYLGKVEDSPDSDLHRMLTWLRKNYNVAEINTHTNLETGDVWLNLDWWKDPNTGKNLTKHPGGLFFRAASQVPILMREGVSLEPLRPINDLPQAYFKVWPNLPNAGEITSFNSSISKDVGGMIVAYKWDFGDGNTTDWTIVSTVNHIYSKGGNFTVNLTVEDDDNTCNISSKNIIINNPPYVNFTIRPPNPVVGDLVKFNASESYDEEDGSSLQYYWEINNGSALFRAACPPNQTFDEPGMHWINLTVTDKNGAKGYRNKLLKINQPPVPRIIFNSTNLSIGSKINFSAAASEDLDGEIVGYSWDFGDERSADCNETAHHIYETGGNKMVNLSLTDNDGAVSRLTKEIYINWPPTAKFSIDPPKPIKGEPISFNASSSTDPDGDILEYSWDFGEGKVEPDVYSRNFADYAYYRSQEYNVTLTVRDGAGAVGSFRQLVKVMDPVEKGSRMILATASDDGTARLWDSTSGQQLHELASNEMVYWIAFSSDSQKVATSGNDNTTRIWDVASGLELHKLPHKRWVNKAFFSPDDRMIVTASGDETACIWDATSGRELHRLNHSNWVNMAVFSSDGQKVATASGDNTSILWDVTNGNKLHIFNHQGYVFSVTFNSDGQKVATSSADKTARIWDVQSGIELHRFHHENSVYSIFFSPDSQTAATASRDGTARIWNTANGQELHRFNHSGPVYTIAFSPDGQKVATASGDKTARIWDVQSGRELHKLQHDGPVKCVVFSLDGLMLATASRDKTARIWDVQSGRELHKLQHDGPVNCVAFSSN